MEYASPSPSQRQSIDGLKPLAPMANFVIRLGGVREWESESKQQTLDVWRSYTVYLEKTNGVYKVWANCLCN